MRVYAEIFPGEFRGCKSSVKRGKVTLSKRLADNLVLDLNRKNEIIGIEIIGPKPEDLKKFKPEAKILARGS